MLQFWEKKFSTCVAVAWASNRGRGRGETRRPLLTPVTWINSWISLARSYLRGGGGRGTRVAAIISSIDSHRMRFHYRCVHRRDSPILATPVSLYVPNGKFLHERKFCCSILWRWNCRNGRKDQFLGVFFSFFFLFFFGVAALKICSSILFQCCVLKPSKRKISLSGTL